MHKQNIQHNLTHLQDHHTRKHTFSPHITWKYTNSHTAHTAVGTRTAQHSTPSTMLTDRQLNMDAHTLNLLSPQEIPTMQKHTQQPHTHPDNDKHKTQKPDTTHKPAHTNTDDTSTQRDTQRT